MCVTVLTALGRQPGPAGPATTGPTPIRVATTTSARPRSKREDRRDGGQALSVDAREMTDTVLLVPLVT